jgi:hypothetical protein
MKQSQRNRLKEVMTPAIDDRVSKARALVADLGRHGFTPRLDAKGALFIVDTTGRRRDLSRRMPIANVFEQLVDGLCAEPGLIETFTAQPKEKRNER